MSRWWTMPRELNLTIDLCLRIGEVLLSSGAGAADVTATMGSVAYHLGLRHPEIDVTFTALSMSYQASPEDPPVLMIRNVKHRDIDYADLTQVDHLVHEVLADQLDLYLARTRMATIVSTGVTVEKAGFKTVKFTDITVNVGSTVTLDVRLEVGGATETVTVNEDAAAIETTRSQTSTVVNERLVRDLPINGRNYLDFTTLTPGVVRDPRGGDLSFGGQRGTLNSFLIDGADSNNLFFGQSTGRQGTRNPYSVSQDAVQEFQVNTNGYSAEVGRAAGGVVNVITKSGTNDLHGGAFFFYRDTNLNANNSINKANNRPRNLYKFRQFGANVGGPVVKNKLFYFFNYDGQRNNEPVPLFAPPGLLAALPTLPSEAQTAYRSIESAYYKDYSRGLDNNVYLFKADWNALENQTVNFRWNANRFIGRNFENARAQRAAEATGDSEVITDSFVGTYTRILGATRLWDVRYSFTRDDQPGEANSDRPETTVQQGGVNVIVFGRNNFSPRYTNSSRNQMISTFSLDHWQTLRQGRRRCELRADLNFFPGQFSGVYLFPSLLDFAQ